MLRSSNNQKVNFLLKIFREISGKSVNQELYYEKDENEMNDEVEDFFQLIVKVKRLRVENVCQRLGLVSLAYLWLKDQSELLEEMIENEMDARIIKICSMGLKPSHLGKSISQLHDYFIKLRDQFQFNVCGEGGEYESAVFDCPLFKSKRIVALDQQIIHHDESEIAPVAHLKFNQFQLEDKDEDTNQRHSELLQNLIESRKYIQDVKYEKIEQNFDWKQSTTDEIIQSHQLEKHYQISKDQIITKFMTIRDIKIEGSGSLELSQSQQVDLLLSHLSKLFEDNGFSLKNGTLKINLYIYDMSQFIDINTVYKKYFGLKPPVRVCVELPNQNQDSLVYIQAIGMKEATLQKLNRQNLHVQGYSQWAPANIGPYSQANQLNGNILLAGNIGLIPEHMLLQNSLQLLGANIFISSDVDIKSIMPKILDDFKIIPTSIIRVGKLPRLSLIEIELFCNKEADHFQMEPIQSETQQTIVQSLIKQNSSNDESDDQIEESKSENNSINILKFTGQIKLNSDISEEIQLQNQINLVKSNILKKLKQHEKTLSFQMTIYKPHKFSFDSNHFLQKVFETEGLDVSISTIPVYEAYNLQLVDYFKTQGFYILWTMESLDLN
ncbi:UNKNOWN [Stylonychia lemnae]|uniref:Diphthine--ammonia ligase n=1 Tax=Stylonychia lemnae TaxID=5949 RepID=A0A078B2H5_STYLE|nr:UNKNOWN [Stylonychia lemnae]|eukprot:CDW88436.1 UNKNOWN [Stylonychia lemnae]